METDKALWIVLSAFLFLFLIVDLVTTHYAFSLGAVEKNPLFSEDDPFIKFILPKLLASLFLIVYMISLTATSWAGKSYKKVYFWFLYGLTVFYVMMMYSNVKTIIYLM